MTILIQTMAPKRKRTQTKKGSSEEREEKSAKQAKPNAKQRPPVPTELVYNYTIKYDNLNTNNKYDSQIVSLVSTLYSGD